MKIVFPLFSCLPGKKIFFPRFHVMYDIFPCLGEIYFGEMLGWKVLRKANIQNG